MPEPPEMQFSEAVSALRGGRLADAEKLCRQVLKQRRKHLDALSMMAHIAMRRLAFTEAESYLKQCLALRPKEPYLHQQLAKVYGAQGRFKEAIARFDHMLKLQPGHPDAIAGKAAAFERRGDHDRARALLDPVVAAGRETPPMAATLAVLLDREGRHDEAAALLTKHLARSDLDADHRVTLSVQLGKARERAEAYDDAFEAYLAANTVHATSFDADRFIRTRDEIIGAFSAEAFARCPRAATTTRLPVFIAGTARSGTTMVDRIIDAHPKGVGIGETELVRDFAKRIAAETGTPHPYPRCVADLTQEHVDRLSKKLLAEFTRRACGASRVADKSISNFSHLGVIAMLFPEAAIIHIRRDPMDACFSMFAEPLALNVHPYSNDLRNLGIYHREYRRLMQHWREETGIRMLEVDYEDLVADPARWIPTIIEFCGLEWDDACLRFHESGRTALTFSYDQVRRPIYRTSVGRAERFRAHLGPLIDSLGT